VRAGEQIDSKTVKKHKNDVFRLLINISPLSRVIVGDAIMEDINRFLEKITEDEPDLVNLGIRRFTLEELLARIKEIYSIL
jgi:hypothetical protein